MVRVDANDSAENIKFLNVYKKINYDKKITLLTDKVFLNRDDWLKSEYLDLIIRLLNDIRFQKIFIQKLKISDLFLFIQIYSLSIKYKSDPDKVLQESFAFKNKTHNREVVPHV